MKLEQIEQIKKDIELNAKQFRDGEGTECHAILVSYVFYLLDRSFLEDSAEKKKGIVGVR